MAYSQVTLSQILDQLSERMGNNTVFWTTAEKTAAINEAISVWQALTGKWVGQLQVTPVFTDENFAAAPQQLVSTQRIYTLAGSPLTPSSMQELDQGMGDWQTSGTAALWAPAGINHVAFAPAPSGAVVFYGMLTPPVLQFAGDYIDVGQEDLNRLLDYALWYLSFKEGPTEALETDDVFASMLEAAGTRNQVIKSTALYRKYMGVDRNAGLRPTQVEDTEGAR